MLIMSEHNCPECKKKIFCISKLGGDTLFVALVDEKNYKEMIKLDKQIMDRAWYLGKSYDNLEKVLDSYLVPMLSRNMMKMSEKEEEVNV